MPVLPKEARAYWLPSRPDAYGHEKHGKRMCVALSVNDCHNSGILIGVPITTGVKKAFFVESGIPVKQEPRQKEKSTSRYDPQHVWTLLSSEIINEEDRTPQHLPLLREEVRKLLAFRNDEPSVPLRQGRIVYIRLEPRHLDARSMSAPLPPKGSDFYTYEHTFRSMLGLDPEHPNDWRIPCIVLTSRAVLNDASEPVSDVITVCPLVPIDDPSTFPITMREPKTGAYFAPLTVCLMSIDPNAVTVSGKPRLEYPRLPWGVNSQTTEAVCRRVLSWLGIERLAADALSQEQVSHELERARAILPLLTPWEHFAPPAIDTSTPSWPYGPAAKAISGLAAASLVTLGALRSCPPKEPDANSRGDRPAIDAGLDTPRTAEADRGSTPGTRVVDGILEHCRKQPNGFEIKKCLTDSAGAQPVFEDAKALYDAALGIAYDPTGFGNRPADAAGSINLLHGTQVVREGELNKWQDMIAHGGLAALHSRFGHDKEAGIELREAFNPLLDDEPHDRTSLGMPGLSWWDCILWLAIERRAFGGREALNTYRSCQHVEYVGGSPSSGWELKRYEEASALAEAGQHNDAADAFATLLNLSSPASFNALHPRWKHVELSNDTIRTNAATRLAEELRKLSAQQKALVHEGLGVWIASKGFDASESQTIVAIAPTEVRRDDDDCETVTNQRPKWRDSETWRVTVDTGGQFGTEFGHQFLKSALFNPALWAGETAIGREALEIEAVVKSKIINAQTDPRGCRDRSWELRFCLTTDRRLLKGTCP